MKALILLVAASLAACSAGSKPSRFQPGKPLFKFAYPRVSELSLFRDDPVTGDRWSAQFVREGNGRWMIRSGPEGLPLLDRFASSGFIDHLLDTLATLRVSGEPRHEDSPEILSRLGLSPASHWLRWREGDSQFELKLGARTDPFRFHAASEGEIFAVEGAALKMLEYSSDFKRLRHSKLMLWTLDDTDRLEITWHLSRNLARPKKLRVERHSGGWALPGARRLLPPLVQQAVEAFPQLEIETFDVPQISNPWVTFEWKNRDNETVRVEIDGNLRARTSDRPGTAFQLHLNSRKLLAPAAFGVK